MKSVVKYIPYLFFFLLTIIYFKNVFFLPPGKIIFGMDTADQFFFWKSYLTDNLRQGIIPFWNPYSFSGTPFLAHPSVAPFYPFTLIFFIRPMGNALLIYLFIHLLLAAIFSYICFRDKIDTVAALTGSIVFTFSALLAARIYSGHLDIISTIIWIPLVYHSFVGFYETHARKYFLLSVTSLTLQILAGYQFVVLLTLELLGLFVIYHLITLYSRNLRRSIPGILSTLLIFAGIVIAAYGISAIQILPTLELVGNSIRSGGLPYDLAKWGSYNFDTFRLFLNPSYYGSPFGENYSYFGPGPNFFELIYFIGKIPLVLIAIDFFLAYVRLIRRKKAADYILFYCFSIIIFMAIALGGNFFFHQILYQFVPFYQMFRIPAQHLIIVVFILSLLVSKALFTLKNKYLRIALLVLIVFELFSYNQKFIRTADLPTANFDQKLINLFKNERTPARILINYPVTSRVRSDIDFEASAYYQLFSTGGYNPIILKNYYQFIDLLNQSPASSIPYYNVEIPPLKTNAENLDFLNTKYLLADKLDDTVEETKNSKYSVISEGINYRLYLNRDFSQRFFLVYSPIYYLNPDEERELFLNKNIMLKKDVLLKGIANTNDTISNNCDHTSDSVQMLDYQINKIKLSVSTNCGGWLSSSEIYYPGWKAKLDGKPINILLSNKAFRTIFVPKGNHSLEYYYDPVIYKLGLIVTITSLITAYLFSKSRIFYR